MKDANSKSLKPITILWYAIAMFLPIIYFTVLTDNTNETHPVRCFIICPILYAIAGILAIPGAIISEGKFGDKLKWILWSMFVGLVEAVLLAFAF